MLRAAPDHPKFAELKAILGQPKGPVAGWLEMLWHFTGRFTPQGNIGKYSDQAIETWVEWDGAPGSLIQALIQAGWIDRDPVHRLLVHDWSQHADKATKNALMRAKLEFCSASVRTEYERGTNKEPESGTPSRLPEPEPEPVPEPEPETVSAKSCAAASATPIALTPVSPATWEGKPLTLETAKGEQWPVPAADCVAWADAFPGVNIIAELLKMRGWLQANPRNRKTSNGMKRFIFAWLERAQNSSRPSGTGVAYNGNRGQSRTNGNLAALAEARARRNRGDAGDSSGSETSADKRGDIQRLLAAPGGIPN